MASFLEERLPIDVRIGMSYADDYAVLITQTASGAEYRKLVQPFPVRSFHVNFTTDQADLWERVLALYHRSRKSFFGFRVKCLDDFSTNNLTGVPTPLDEPGEHVQRRLSAAELLRHQWTGSAWSRLPLPNDLQARRRHRRCGKERRHDQLGPDRGHDDRPDYDLSGTADYRQHHGGLLLRHPLPLQLADRSHRAVAVGPRLRID